MYHIKPYCPGNFPADKKIAVLLGTPDLLRTIHGCNTYDTCQPLVAGTELRRVLYKLFRLPASYCFFCCLMMQQLAVFSFLSLLGQASGFVAHSAIQTSNLHHKPEFKSLPTKVNILGSTLGYLESNHTIAITNHKLAAWSEMG